MAEDPNQDSKAKRAAGSAAQDPLVGRIIHEKYRLLELVARGAMARVYRAETVAESTPCAFKILDTSCVGVDDPEFQKSFLRETAIAAKLTHPNTARILGYGGTDEVLGYVAMEFLEGRTLHRALREDGPFPEERVVHIAKQICRSLREAQEMNLLHRDLRPSNVFLVERDDEQDFVKVLDFGLVRNSNEGTGRHLSQEKRFLGSPKYLTPEQIRGDKLDSRSDMYGLGLLCFEMLTGRVPFSHKNPAKILEAHLAEPPPSFKSIYPEVSLSTVLEEIVLRCLQKLPELRYSSLDQILEALKYLGTGPAIATLATPISESRPAALAPPTESDGSSEANRPTTPRVEKPASEQAAVKRMQSLVAKRDGTTTVNTEQERARRALSPWQNLIAIVAGATLVVGVATLGAWAVRTVDSAATNPSTSQSSASVRVAVETSPEGASVRSEQGNVLCEPTPCQVVLVGEAAIKGVRVTIRRDGYREETRLLQGGAKVVVPLAPSQP